MGRRSSRGISVGGRRLLARIYEHGLNERTFVEAICKHQQDYPPGGKKEAASEASVGRALKRWLSGDYPERYIRALVSILEVDEQTIRGWYPAVGHGEQPFDDRILMWDYPAQDYKDHFATANTLLISGLSLRRILLGNFKFQKRLERIVCEEGGSVTVVMLDPASRAGCEYGWMQDYWTDEGEPQRTIDAYRDEVAANYATFKGIQDKLIKLKKEHELRQNQTGEEKRLGEFHVWALDYILSCGIDVIDPGDDKGVMYIRKYPLASQKVGDDVPVIRLYEKHNKKWFDFYLEQFNLYIKLAEQQAAGKPRVKKPSRSR